jgi:hypothetical protein
VRIELLVPLSTERVRERLRGNADRHRYSPFSRSREAGSRPLIFNEQNGQLVFHLRGWMPDFFGLEARLTLDPVGHSATRVRASFQVPTANRVVLGVGLAFFVVMPLVAFAVSNERDPTVLPFVSLPLVYFLVLPFAYRLYRQDDRQLMRFLKDSLPEADWRPAQTVTAQ